MSKREFVLTDGTRFIKQNADGKFRQTTNIGLADIYNSVSIADNIRLNSIPKALSRTYRVAEIVNGEIIQIQSFALSSEKARTGEVIHYDNIHWNNEWCAKFEGLDGIFEKAFKRGNELANEIREIDLKIVDVEHYIEFNRLNAREGYKIYKRLNELFCKRRSLKFEQKIVTSINKNYKASEYISDIITTINECKNDIYKPRILTYELLDKMIGKKEMANERKNYENIDGLRQV